MSYRIKSNLPQKVTFPLGDDRYLEIPQGPFETTVDELPENVRTAIETSYKGLIKVERQKQSQATGEANPSTRKDAPEVEGEKTPEGMLESPTTQQRRTVDERFVEGKPAHGAGGPVGPASAPVAAETAKAHAQPPQQPKK